MKPLYFLIFSFLSINLFAQNPFDCVDALEVCDEAPITIQYSGPVAGFVYENAANGCFPEHLDSTVFENNCIWLKYHFATSGDFTFTINPALWDDDLDFIAFKTNSQSCDDLEAIRCMFSGENVGGEIDTICLGPTGLSAMSVDTVEFPGCSPDSDNFLAPIDVNNGDVIYLAVISWYGTNDYTIEHGGSAIISCTPVNVSEAVGFDVKVYPNPVKDQLHLMIGEPLDEMIRVEIIDASGRIVLKKEFVKATTIDVSNFPKGIYFVQIGDYSNQRIFKKIILN